MFNRILIEINWNLINFSWLKIEKWTLHCDFNLFSYKPTRLWGFSGHVQTVVHSIIGRVRCPWPIGERVVILLPDETTLTYDLYQPLTNVHEGSWINKWIYGSPKDCQKWLLLLHYYYVIKSLILKMIDSICEYFYKRFFFLIRSELHLPSEKSCK